MPLGKRALELVDVMGVALPLRAAVLTLDKQKCFVLQPSGSDFGIFLQCVRVSSSILTQDAQLISLEIGWHRSSNTVSFVVVLTDDCHVSIADSYTLHSLYFL